MAKTENLSKVLPITIALTQEAELGITLLWLIEIRVRKIVTEMITFQNLLDDIPM